MPELALLASGASQHVFVRADDPDGPWVYKTAAFLDELLPGVPRLDRLRPTRLASRVAYAAAFTAPRALWKAGSGAEASADSPGRAAGAVRRCRDSYVNALARLSAHYARRGRIRRFASVVSLHRSLDNSACSGVLLPVRVLTHASATLVLPGRAVAYEGPMLQQRRADAFFDSVDDIQRFAWDDLVHSQRMLWRIGVGFADGASAIGPFGWALLDGRLFVGDSGSLTRSVQEVRHCLGPSIEERWRKRLARLRGEQFRLADAYYRHVRQQLNVATLAGAWRTSA